MQELRWNPILKEWIIVASHRKERPVEPSSDQESSCPFCRGDPHVEGPWEVKAIPNRFPSLSIPAPQKRRTFSRLFKLGSAKGFCEVILETKDHETDLGSLPVERILKVIELFADRFEVLGARKEIRYVYAFRNRGKEIGVTLSHPHSQLYALPFIPPIVKRELASSKEYFEKFRRCLFCEVMNEESKDVRTVLQNKSFVCFLPFYSRWPYETHVYPLRHCQSLLDLNSAERWDLAQMLKLVSLAYDSLFESPMPYVMAMHQRPTDGRKYDYFHFHIEFYPPYREKNLLKFLGGVEQGAGTFIYDADPEAKAAELRKAAERVRRRFPMGD
jgi:UDPglucose--hexose-1-phosphate uridylyltransferase